MAMTLKLRAKKQDYTLKIQCHDMHTGGEPLRIVTGGFPEMEGETVCQKRRYVQEHLDRYRKFLMNEPRGHKDMYGVILIHKQENEFEALFLNNEGYSAMCGHAIIALGRFIIDYDMVTPTVPETELLFHCPCGPVTAYVETTQVGPEECVTGCVRFNSVPAFVYASDVLHIPKLGITTEINIVFGGAYYVIISDKALSIDLKSTPLATIIDVATTVTEFVKQKVPIKHPDPKCLDVGFLYGTIITDGNDNSSDPSTNVCVFADRQVDRSPTGSGVTARIALEFSKGSLCLDQVKEFKSILGTSFKGKVVKQTKVGEFPAIVVEVSGMAHHSGDHIFYLEDTDPFPEGFQI